MNAAASENVEKDMVSIPRSEFTMGSSEHADEMRHQVVVDRYLIDKYEASNERYKAFMKETGHPAPAYWDDPRLNKPEQPVVGVSWTDANAFCKWEGKRLPTEAEWERAAKGSQGDNHYPWGHNLDMKKDDQSSGSCSRGAWHSPVSDIGTAAQERGGFALQTHGTGFRCARSID